MYDKLLDDKLLVEIKNLVDKVDSAKNDMDLYCEFMHKKMLLLSNDN